MVGLGGVGTAQPDHDRGNESPQTDASQDHPEFECPDGMESLGTFEFVPIEDDDGELLDCYFQQDDGEFNVTITGYESTEGEACKPIAVSYESESHVVEQVESFGGTDSHVDADPTDGVYESELETPDGHQAAISLLHFCGTTRGTDDEESDADNSAD